MTREQLEKSIYEAFKDVKLEDGIGLLEASKIDDYYKRDSKECKEAYQRDEREDWKKLLPNFNYSLTGEWHFMDAKGIRFHLPCFLLSDLDSTSPWDDPLVFTLATGPVGDPFDRLKILNVAQKQVVIDFLNYELEEFKNKKLDFIIDNYKKAKENFEKYIMDS